MIILKKEKKCRDVSFSSFVLYKTLLDSLSDDGTLLVNSFSNIINVSPSKFHQWTFLQSFKIYTELSNYLCLHTLGTEFRKWFSVDIYRRNHVGSCQNDTDSSVQDNLGECGTQKLFIVNVCYYILLNWKFWCFSKYGVPIKKTYLSMTFSHSGGNDTDLN